MSTITEVVPPFTKVPNINDSANFENDVNPFLNEINTRYISGNTQVSQINTVAGEVDPNAINALSSTTSASNSALIALGSTNYKGDWIPNYDTTGYNLNMSVSYTDGYNYVSKIDNNLTEPTTLTNTPEWNFIENVNPNNYYTKTQNDNLLADKTKKTAEVIQWETDNSQELTWIGATYIDTDAVGANPVAMLYPDGTIVGSTSNGIYIKHPNGNLECRGVSTSVTTSNASGSVFFENITLPYYPIPFVTDLPNIIQGVEEVQFLIWNSGTIAESLTRLTTRLIGSAINSKGYIHYVAKGRWK